MADIQHPPHPPQHGQPGLEKDMNPEHQTHDPDYHDTGKLNVKLALIICGSSCTGAAMANGVAPGPVWARLIPSTFPSECAESFGKHVPIGRAGQPEEAANCFVFLASDATSYIPGRVVHPNGET